LGQAYDYWQDQPGILHCNYLLQSTSRRRSLKASISELIARLGGYALIVYQSSRLWHLSPDSAKNILAYAPSEPMLLATWPEKLTSRPAF